MSKVFVAGVAMTPTGKLPEPSVKSLTEEAICAALNETGLPSGNLQAAFFANATQAHLEGQLLIVGQGALRAMGLGARP